MKKRVGILTSGGDAPGMNAAIRAVTRTAIYNGFTVKGILRGYRGLVTNEIVDFHSSSVSNIIQLGGTILKTARCEEFKSVEGRQQAYENLKAAGIDALVVIGGDMLLKGEFPQRGADTDFGQSGDGGEFPFVERACGKLEGEQERSVRDTGGEGGHGADSLGGVLFFRRILISGRCSSRFLDE